MKKKKVPMRMCLGCREMKPKKELIRVVRDAATEEVRIDETGRSNGRGAYMCPAEECIASAQKSRGLDRALGVKVDPEIYDLLRSRLRRPDEGKKI